MSDRFAHVAAVVTGVVTGAARDADRGRIVIVDDGTPEATLLERMLREAGCGIPIERVAGADPEDTRMRVRRAAAGDGLTADPVNKTVAILFPELLTEPLLPLADLYAGEVRALAGDWSAPPEARAFFERVGGVDVVDSFLRRHLEERRPLDEASVGVEPAAARELADRYLAGWWWRRRAGLVPKLGSRTLGLDLR